MLRGYDIDGVLTAGVEPIQPCVFITGRSLPGWRQTYEEFGHIAPIYLSPYGEPGVNEKIAQWKAHVIEALGIGEFTDDCLPQLRIIAERCPDCVLIHHVDGRFERLVKQCR